MDERGKHGHGSEYLQSFAKFLKAECMNKSVQDIFGMVDSVMKVSFSRNGYSMKFRVAIT